jgi:hypothetical protein
MRQASASTPIQPDRFGPVAPASLADGRLSPTKSSPVSARRMVGGRPWTTEANGGASGSFGGSFGRDSSDGDGGFSERPAAEKGAAALIGGTPPPGGVVGEWVELNGVLMFRRTKEEREANPERLNLDRYRTRAVSTKPGYVLLLGAP